MAPTDPSGRPGRILIIVQNLPVPFDRRVWLECQALIAAGFQVSVICPKGTGDPSRQTIDGVRIYRYAPPPAAAGPIGYALEFGYCWLRTALLSVLVALSYGFDVIQACNPPDTYFVLAAFYKLFGKRFVYDQHDLCPELFESRFRGRGSRRLLSALKTLERLTYSTADRVISTNDSYREVALSRGGKQPETVTVVRSGPNNVLLEPALPEPALKRGRKHLACYLGVMGPQDGVDLLLAAVHHYVKVLKREDTHFALLGFGDCLDALKTQASVLGLDEFVEFTGRANTQLIRRYFSSADVGLQPDPKSPLNDVSTMNKTMEYMGLGLPVVAFDLKETRVTAEQSAVYVPDDDPALFGDALADLLDAPERRAKMGRVGRARVLHHLAWEHQARAFVEVYEGLIGRPESQALSRLSA